MPWIYPKFPTFLRSVSICFRYLFAAYGLLTLILFYTPTADYLVRPLQVPADVRPAPAIVVLTAYVSPDGVMNQSAMRRIHAAARLYRRGLSPLVIISGGDPSSRPTGQTVDVMAQFAGELGIPPSAIMLEKASENTHSSAKRVAALCRERNIERILLVTDAAHMRRAVGAFRVQHLSVSPVPADPWALNWETPGIRLEKFWEAFHEYGGLLYYWWRGWI